METLSIHPGVRNGRRRFAEGTDSTVSPKNHMKGKLGKKIRTLQARRHSRDATIANMKRERSGLSDQSLELAYKIPGSMK